MQHDFAPPPQLEPPPGMTLLQQLAWKKRSQQQQQQQQQQQPQQQQQEPQQAIGQSQTPLGADSGSWAANIWAAALSHQRRRITLPITRAGARGQVGARGPSLGSLLALVSDLVGVRVLSAVNAGLDDMSAILLASALVHPSCTLEVLILRANGKSMPIFSSSDSLDPAAHRARVAARRAERDGPGCTR
jgi:hypothetical protein